MSVSAVTDVDINYNNPYRTPWRCSTNTTHAFGTIDDKFLYRTDLMDITKNGMHPFFRHDPSASFYNLDRSSQMGGGGSGTGSDSVSPRPAHQLSTHSFYTGMFNHNAAAPHHLTNLASEHPLGFDAGNQSQPVPTSHTQAQLNSLQTAQQNHNHTQSLSQQHPSHLYQLNSNPSTPALNQTHMINRSLYSTYSNPVGLSSNGYMMSASPNTISPPYGAMSHVHEIDYDPRELEAFAERFKQRRIKLGVTQADVGRALGNLKITGVGSLSQSTICRFESLTLSHNNMVALKPILQAWLEDAEKLASDRQKHPDMFDDALDKKRKRTSITDAEKRSLEAYFTIQPRPSSEKIAQISEKLNLKKNVVRVWFCNQRQKQKRMKFSTVNIGHMQ